jgi:hypothetical protein
MSSRKKPITQTAEYKKLVAIRAFIEAHPIMLPLGQDTPIAAIATAFGVTPPQPTNDMNENIKRVSRYNLKMTYWQVLFNRILNQRGIYMAKRGNYYTILQLPAAKKKAKTIKKQGRRKLYASTQLLAGISAHRGIYTHVEDSELYTVANYYRA